MGINCLGYFVIYVSHDRKGYVRVVATGPPPQTLRSKVSQVLRSIVNDPSCLATPVSKLKTALVAAQNANHRTGIAVLPPYGAATPLCALQLVPGVLRRSEDFCEYPQAPLSHCVQLACDRTLSTLSGSTPFTLIAHDCRKRKEGQIRDRTRHSSILEAEGYVATTLPSQQVEESSTPTPRGHSS